MQFSINSNFLCVMGMFVRPNEYILFVMESMSLGSCVHFRRMPSKGEKKDSALFVFLKEGNFLYKLYVSDTSNISRH